jgi:hypothetical protein
MVLALGALPLLIQILSTAIQGIKKNNEFYKKRNVK